MADIDGILAYIEEPLLFALFQTQNHTARWVRYVTDNLGDVNN